MNTHQEARCRFAAKVGHVALFEVDAAGPVILEWDESLFEPWRPGDVLAFSPAGNWETVRPGDAFAMFFRYCPEKGNDLGALEGKIEDWTSVNLVSPELFLRRGDGFRMGVCPSIIEGGTPLSQQLSYYRLTTFRAQHEPSGGHLSPDVKEKLKSDMQTGGPQNAGQRPGSSGLETAAAPPA